jgi:hypothetical protein
VWSADEGRALEMAGLLEAGTVFTNSHGGGGWGSAALGARARP